MTATGQAPCLAATARRGVVCGLIAYRALFNWAKPSIYLPTVLGGAFFQVIFVTELGTFSGVRDRQFFLLGSAIQVCAVSCVFGMGMLISNERRFGTLGPVLATPASRLTIFLSRTWPVVAGALFVSLFALGTGTVVLGVRLAPGVLPGIIAVLVVAVCSCTAFGFLLGAVGLYTRDILFAGNVAYPLMLLLCGVAVPRDRLPAWLRVTGEGLPLTHGIDAVRRLVDGAALTDVAATIAAEGIVGCCYAIAGYGLLRLLEVLSRHHNTLEEL